MLLIYSKGIDEFVNKVICYLLDTNVIRFGTIDGLKIDTIAVNNELTIVNDTLFKKKISLNEVKAIWFNGGVIQNSHDSKVSEELNELLTNNYSTLLNGYLNYSNVFKIGRLLNSFECNKLDVLLFAQDAGFLIPDTLFTENKSELHTFYYKHLQNGIISKRIGDSTHYNENNQVFNLVNTFEVNKNLLNKIPKTFGLSQFQEKIERQYEIRVVYLFGTCYSMAIFTNSIDKSVDYRINLNKNEGIRMVPFNLGKVDEHKLFLLMNKLNLNYGSIDFIVDFNDNRYLLEVNPCGQISFLNESCNYYLEKEISELMLNKMFV